MLAHLAELILPRRCVGCGQPGAPLCSQCGRASPVERYVSGVATVHAACRYQAGVRRAVIAYKERGRRELAVPLGALLAESLPRTGFEPPAAVLVPVPSSPAARRGRDFDHVALLAETAAALLAETAVPSALSPSAEGARNGGRPVRKLLTVGRPLPDSAGLSVRERRSRLAGAFTARRRPPEEAPDVVVVDDVITTGASVREAVRALQAAGWQVRGVAVVAATPRRSAGNRRGTDLAPVGLGDVSGSGDRFRQRMRWSPGPGGVNVRTT